MADSGRGHRFFFQAGKETVAYGTAAAATGTRLWGYNWKAKPNPGIEEEGALMGLGLEEREVYQLGRFWEWEFETDLNYVGNLKFWAMLMGTDASPATPAVTGPDANGIYTHTFKVGKSMDSYTFEVCEGDPGFASKVSRFLGCMVEKISISGRAGTSSEAKHKMKISGVAQTRSSAFTPTVLTLANPRAALFHHASIVDDGSADAGADIVVRGWGIDIASPITRDRFKYGTSNLLFAPQRDKKFRAEMTFNQEWQTETQYANFLANANLSPEMEFTGPELVGAAGFRSIKFTANRSRLIDLDPGALEFGLWKVDLKHLCLYNPADSSGLIVTIKTDTATIALG